MKNWKKYEKETLHPVGEEVVVHNRKWNNKDFNINTK